MTPPDDPPVDRWREQQEGLHDAAMILFQFYSDLKEQGFSAPEALSLTRAWFIAQVQGLPND